MKREGIIIECKVKGCAKEVPDIGYPIPDSSTNQYYLDNLLTRRSDREERAIKREDDY